MSATRQIDAPRLRLVHAAEPAPPRGAQAHGVAQSAPQPCFVSEPRRQLAVDEHDLLDTIEYLEFQIEQLCETILHLGTSRAPVPAHLRVVLWRAMHAFDDGDARI